ncbi:MULTISPECIES: hypothetical protein [Chromobacterium]|uniref:Transmembrane protein n=2 Tax=Chromobacterium TaxID=535 RepID=A0ABS3GG09_9NEIS|nr:MULTISPECIES: hypothetical protein [Chromobacterium]AXT48505.1 hypothetical protein D1345_21085 [Chromobacterium rhizoryzae]MBK0412882.1 hypothetical protein [Chromobacterium haemolyticum]MBO0413984.1 hypothetical protein [Chromobacterium haemolyticum]MBO0497244.1 hypothetical protein [Chromobacterium haemolyticum]MDH0341855.1 hypothetical protein [Chromobacterium haemolyticum]
MSRVDELSQQASPAEPSRRRGRFKLLLMAAICLAPVLASWAAYRLMPPEGGKSYGQLLPTRPFALIGAQGWPRGKWVLAARIEPGCQTRCQQRFFAMRQIQRAQGEAAGRLTRLGWQEEAAHEEVDATHIVQSAQTGVDDGGYYLVDPLGNQVLFYPDAADPKKVIQEIGRVLKTNNGIG